MTYKSYNLIILIFTVLSSYTRVHYIEDSYQATSEIEVCYKNDDVKLDYSTLG